MAQDIIVLVRTELDLNVVVEYLNTVVGHPFVKSSDTDGNLFHVTVMGVFLDLYDDHDFENDQDIEFDSYQLVLGVQGSTMLDPFDSSLNWVKSVALFFARVIAQQFDCECLVVENFQKIVQQVKPSDSAEGN